MTQNTPGIITPTCAATMAMATSTPLWPMASRGPYMPCKSRT
ncbi:MAG: hypothetical protein BWY85_01665 [Firmicutes bacterium ADurb.Bin506]|nr:MAG: hypothetical protein BWY85_01665 [Firmicutes bacterium ADurb.Bin506]